MTDNEITSMVMSLTNTFNRIDRYQAQAQAALIQIDETLLNIDSLTHETMTPEELLVAINETRTKTLELIAFLDEQKEVLKKAATINGSPILFDLSKTMQMFIS